MTHLELRNIVWPLPDQPMPREDIARGVAVTFGVSVLEARRVVDELNEDIETCKRHIWSIMSYNTPVTVTTARDNAKREVAPISDTHFDAMWKWASFVIAKGG